LGVVVPAIVWIVPAQPSTAEEPATVELAIVKSASVEFAECGAEATTMDAAKPAAMEPAAPVKTSAPMEPTTSAMRLRVSQIWLAERGKAQQGGCGSAQSPSDPGSAFILA
jgi:hypothetical protein